MYIFCILATVFTCCKIVPCEAKVVSGKLITNEDWVFITRFCFLSNSGMLQFDVQFPDTKDGSKLHILLYFDDASQWPSVYKNNSKNCFQKEAVLNPEDNQIVYLTEREGWTGCQPTARDGTVRCQASRSFQSVRERWWFIAASRCGSNQGVNMTYKLHLTNGDDLFQKEFSADEFYILEVNIAFCVVIAVLFFASCIVAVKLYKKKLFHTTFRLYMLSISTQLIALIILSATYGQYANDGLENYTAKTFGHVFEAISILTFLLLLILMGKGFTVTRGRISTSGSVKLAIFMTLYAITYAVLFIYQALWFDPGLVLYLYQSPPGYGLLVIRLIGWLWFCYAIVFTLKHFPSKAPFYCLLFIFYTIWFWANPVAVLIANLAMPQWVREKVANAVFDTMAFCSLVCFLYLTWPSQANKNFPYHIRTTQIDFVRDDDDSVASTSNSRASWELKPDDTTDGLRFTDLFTVSNSVSGSNQQRRSEAYRAPSAGRLEAATKQPVFDGIPEQRRPPTRLPPLSQQPKPASTSDAEPAAQEASTDLGHFTTMTTTPS